MLPVLISWVKSVKEFNYKNPSIEDQISHYVRDIVFLLIWVIITTILIRFYINKNINISVNDSINSALSKVALFFLLGRVAITQSCYS